MELTFTALNMRKPSLEVNERKALDEIKKANYPGKNAMDTLSVHHPHTSPSTRYTT